MQNTNSLFSRILKSSFDFKFYKSVWEEPFGQTLRYLLLLSLFVSVVIGVHTGIILGRLSQKGLKWAEEKIPSIEIVNGEASSGVEQPFKIEDDKFILIIDTTGTTQEIGKEYKSGILLARNKLTFKQDDVRTQEFSFARIKQFRLDKKSLGTLRKFFIGIIIPFIIIMQFVYFFIAKIVQVLITGLAIRVFKPQYRYNQILNLCIYAVTPPTLLAVLVLLVSPKPLLFFPLIYLGMYIAFIIGGMRQIHSE